MTDAPGSVVTDEILEDCLQAVQRSAEQGRPATAADVTAFARIPASTAEAALRELRVRGLLDSEAGGLALSDEGRRQAAAVIRRHRLSERLLTDVLGLPWDRVHDEAMRLEHSLTPEAESRLRSLLNDPETCPHGSPIPGSGGAAQPSWRLDTVPAGTRVRIEQIAEEEAVLLRYLASLGLLPKTPLTVEEVAPFGGPLLVQVGGSRYAIGRDVAAKILVRGDAEAGPRRRRHRRRGR
jgi:DtxR family Mn-dependent transcriptional regulator